MMVLVLRLVLLLAMEQVLGLVLVELDRFYQNAHHSTKASQVVV
jgi:hypothetical protein